jgi:hypothetical protein
MVSREENGHNQKYCPLLSADNNERNASRQVIQIHHNYIYTQCMLRNSCSYFCQIAILSPSLFMRFIAAEGGPLSCIAQYMRL